MGSMMRRSRIVLGLIVVLIGLMVAAAVLIVRQTVLGPKTITAYFSTATATYPGDEVRVAGIRAGTIAAVEPEGTRTKVTLKVDHDVPVPADAKAIIVAQNLVASRYVQLTPPYRGDGPTMPDGAEIPLNRTAVPVEWDEVKAELTRLATDLGPASDVSTSSVGRLIETSADALQGNGEKLRKALAQLSGVGRILADGSGNIVDVIKNLQVFVSALRNSSEQIVQFEDRLATLSSVLNDNRSDLDAALTDLSAVVGDVRRFVAGTRNQASESIQRLANVTQTVADHKLDLENVLHVAPNAFANYYNFYNSDTGDNVGTFVFNNFSSPIQFVCSALGAIENTTAPETAKECAQYLGPALRLLSLNNLPIPINPYLGKSMDPEGITYSEPGLAPGGTGAKPGPAEIPPAVSAYTGLDDDVPAPPGYGRPPAVAPGPTAPDHLPADPSPALFPGAPVPAGTSLPGMLLPAEGPAS
jgi:phospholipid/cholesterol/gamma-HCH transport system substrate-binding protein